MDTQKQNEASIAGIGKSLSVGSKLSHLFQNTEQA